MTNHSNSAHCIDSAACRTSQQAAKEIRPAGIIAYCGGPVCLKSIESLLEHKNRSEELLRLALEWAAAYPLKGEAGIADQRAANRLYVEIGDFLGGRQ